MATAILFALIIITFVVVYLWVKEIKEKLKKLDGRLNHLEAETGTTPLLTFQNYTPTNKPKVVLRTEEAEAEKFNIQ